MSPTTFAITLATVMQYWQLPVAKFKYWLYNITRSLPNFEYQQDMQQDSDELGQLEIRKRLIDRISTASVTDTKLIMDLFQKVAEHEEEESKQMSLNAFLKMSQRHTGKSEARLGPQALNSGVKKHQQAMQEGSPKPKRNLLSFFPIKEVAPKTVIKLMEEDWNTSQMAEFINMLNEPKSQSLSHCHMIKFEPDRPATNPVKARINLSIWDNNYFLEGYQFPKHQTAKPLPTSPLVEFQGVVYDLDSDEEYADLCAIDLNCGNDSEDSDDTDIEEEGNSKFLVDDGYLSNDQRDSIGVQEMSMHWVLKVDKWDFNPQSDCKQMRSHYKIISLCGQMLDVDKPVDLCVMFPTRIDQIKESLKVSADSFKLLEAKITQDLMGKFQVSGWVVKEFLLRHCSKKRSNKSCCFKIKQNNQGHLRPSSKNPDSDESLYGFQDSRPFSLTGQQGGKQELTDNQRVPTPERQ